MGAKADIRSALEPNIAMEPQVINTDVTTVGPIIDTAEFDGGVMVTHLVTWTSGVFTPLIEESDSATFAAGVTDVPDASLIGDVKAGVEADAALDAGQLIASVGVVNNLRRYLRHSCVTTLGADGVYAATWHKQKEVQPITNP